MFCCADAARIAHAAPEDVHHPAAAGTCGTKGMPGFSEIHGSIKPLALGSFHACMLHTRKSSRERPAYSPLIPSSFEHTPCSIIAQHDMALDPVNYKLPRMQYMGIVISLFTMSSLFLFAPQHNMALDPVNYKLPRMRYKGAGGPLPQHIRKAPRALVTEVAEDSAAAAAAADPQFALRFDKPRQQKSGQASQASAAASAMQAVPQRLKSAAPPLPPLQQQPLAQSPPLPASASQGAGLSFLNWF